MQPDLFDPRETGDFRHRRGAQDTDAGEPRPASRACRHTIRQRRALARLAEAQARYVKTRSHKAWHRLCDAVTDALRLGV